jgi:SAM-dependent methyltransferase
MADDLAEYVDGAPAHLTPDRVRGDLVETGQAARYWWAAGLTVGRRVLDVGCGVGRGSAILLEGGAGEVVGVDVARAVIEAAQASERQGLRFERGDIEQLRYPDASFDAVVCFDVIEHVEHLDVVLPELARVLALEGVLATSRPGGVTSQDFEAALRRQWRHVRLLGQHDWVGSGVIDDSHPTSERGEPLEPIQVHSVATGKPEDEPQTVGLASATELPDPPPPTAAFSGVLEVRRWLEHTDEQQRALDGQRLHIQRLTTMQRERAELRARLIEAEAQGARVVQLEAELEEARRQRDDLRLRLETSDQILHDVVGSPSWKITKPLRRIKHGLRSRLD